MQRFRFPAACLFAFVALSTAPQFAAAAGPTPAELKEARENFTKGRKLEDEGRFGEALSLFRRVGEVKMTPQVRFHLALCLENTGRIAEAREMFQLAAREASGIAPNVVTEANEHAAALEKRVPKLTVILVKPQPEDEISLDGRTTAHAVPTRVEPGAHVVLVRRSGRVLQERSVTLEEGQSLRIELAPDAQAAQQGPLPPGSTGPGATTGPSVGVTPVGPDEPAPGRVQRLLGWTAIGVSAASLAGVGIFAGLRANELAELTAACPTFTGCPSTVEPIVQNGQTYTTLVNVFAGISGGVALTGVVLLLSAPSAPSAVGKARSRDARIDPSFSFSADRAFVSVEGRF